MQVYIFWPETWDFVKDADSIRPWPEVTRLETDIADGILSVYNICRLWQGLVNLALWIWKTLWPYPQCISNKLFISNNFSPPSCFLVWYSGLTVCPWSGIWGHYRYLPWLYCGTIQWRTSKAKCTKEVHLEPQSQIGLLQGTCLWMGSWVRNKL